MRAGRRRRVRPTARGVVTAVGSVVAFVVAYSGVPELLAPACVGLALVATALPTAFRRAAAIEVVRGVEPLPAVAQAPVTVVTTLVSRSSRRIPPAAVVDHAAWLGEPVPVHVRALPPGDSVTIERAGTAPRRGRTQVGPLTRHVEDPLGLVRVVELDDAVDEFLVVPEIVPLVETGRLRLDAAGDAVRALPTPVNVSDEHMTREYRRGDPLRRVHWRATARHGELMVRQEESRADPEARLIVETRRRAYQDRWMSLGADAPESAEFEWAVIAAASLAAHLVDRGYRVHVEEFGRADLDGFEVTADSFARFHERLAMAELGDDVVFDRTPALEGPVFAIVASDDEATLDRIARRRGTEPLAIAYVLPSAGDAAAPLLDAAGWETVPVEAQTSLGDAWDARGSWSLRSGA